MPDDQDRLRDSESESVEEAAAEGPLPEAVPDDESGSSTREDVQQQEGVIPKSDNDLDPDRDLSPEERRRAVARDETVGGIFQPGGRGG